MTIEPDPYWYGTYARRSAVADYLELLALQGGHLSVEGLADVIRDNPGWTHDLGARIGEVDPDPEPVYADLGEEIDASLEAASDVHSVIAERTEVPESCYPFMVGGGGEIAYTGGDPRLEPYIRLLVVTVGHALKVSTPVRPHQVFELMLLEAMSASGGLSAGLGMHRGNFAETLRNACTAVGLSVYPERALAKVFANDEGVDVLTNVFHSDLRPGGLQLVGQATCARSDDWDKKMGEPSEHQWRAWLGGYRSPVAYLAVPHHVEATTRAWLMQKRDRDVVDRIRLTPLLPSAQVEGEEELLTAVLSQVVD